MKIKMMALFLMISSFMASPSFAVCTLTVPVGGSISSAINLSKPGDTICVSDGIYSTQPYVAKSGTMGAYITIKALNPGKAILTAGIAVNSASYVEINGFDITNPNGAGVYMGNCTTVAACGHHVRIVNNTVHDCAGGGINATHGDYHYIVGNTVYRNAFTKASAHSGISLYESTDAVTTDTIGWNGFRNYIANNVVYSNDNCVRDSNDGYGMPPWCISSPTDGNGIILDDNKNTQPSHIQGPYQGNFLIENNLVYDNGGAGIHSYYSANATIRNNQVFWNHRRPSKSSWLGDLSNIYSDNMTWTGNTSVANTCYNLLNVPFIQVGSNGVSNSMVSSIIRGCR